MSAKIGNDAREYRWGVVQNGRVRHAMTERYGDRYVYPLCGEVMPDFGHAVDWERTARPCRTCAPKAERLGLEVP